MFKLFSNLWKKLTAAFDRRDKRQKEAKEAAKKTRKEIDEIENTRRINLGKARNNALKDRRN